MLTLAGGLATATTAEASTIAAGTYGPPPPPPPSLPGFTSVVTSVTVGPHGQIIGPAIIDRARVVLIIPPGAFTTSVQFTIFRGDLAVLRPHVFRGFTATTAVGVIVTLNGKVFPGRFLKAPTLVILSPRITAATIVALWNGISLRTFRNAAAARGILRITFDRDPDFAVLTPSRRRMTPPRWGVTPPWWWVTPPWWRVTPPWWWVTPPWRRLDPAQAEGA